MLDPKDVAKTVFSLINLPKDIYIDEIKIVPKK
jgi:NADP-dependent 3-hydroxy acid dehydrogenase YdfG